MVKIPVIVGDKFEVVLNVQGEAYLLQDRTGMIFKGDSVEFTNISGNSTQTNDFEIPKGLKVFPNLTSQETIEVTRFFRPRSFTGEIISSAGITFVCVLNYLTGYVRVFYSICDGDNFSKSLGVDIARKNLTRSKMIKMPGGKIPSCGLTNFLLSEFLKSPTTNDIAKFYIKYCN